MINNYHSIHCPYCGAVIYPSEIKFSISEFVKEIEKVGTDKYNDGILKIIDTDSIGLITNNEFLWDMSEEDIIECTEDDMFVLSGENIIKRFGEEVCRMLSGIQMQDIKSVFDSIKAGTQLQIIFENNQEVRDIIEEIMKNIPNERLMRENKKREVIINTLLELIRYAKSDKTLLKTDLIITEDKDDGGRVIKKDIRSTDNSIICNSKRCSECGEKLSKMAGKYEEMIISFLGSPSTGKTAYLTAVVNKLKTLNKSVYGITLEYDQQSSDYDHFNQNCLMPYSSGFAIMKTNENDFPQLSIAIKYLKTGKTFLYTFVDIPGEAFLKDTGFKPADVLSHRKIIKYSDVIWFCTSSKQLFALDEDRRSEGIQNRERTDLDIIGQNTNTFVHEVFGTDKKPAVALIITKSDMMSEFIKTMFDGAKKDDYEKLIYSDETDGEPDTLGYMQNGKLHYKKLIGNMKRVKSFLVNEFNDDERKQMISTFIGNIAEAFNKKDCPCFAEASYGRNLVEAYSIENAVRFILNNANPETDGYNRIVDIFGEDKLAEFKAENIPLTVSNDEDERIIKRIYKSLHPMHPFGIMSILEWTFAYTGLVPCVEIADDGENWNNIPQNGEYFKALKSRLTLESFNESAIIVPVQKQDPGHRGFFGKIFGK